MLVNTCTRTVDRRYLVIRSLIGFPTVDKGSGNSAELGIHVACLYTELPNNINLLCVSKSFSGNLLKLSEENNGILDVECYGRSFNCRKYLLHALKLVFNGTTVLHTSLMLPTRVLKLL